ncbi:MAG: hypothetical protein RQ826_17495 [Xanthomonadales bacterium]|nr:hypothetical protein [Xanthomonadales bacterium]
MFRYIAVIVLVFFFATARAQSGVPDPYISQAYVKGVYWNPDELPGWGFFIDIQELTLFGAIYGYDAGEATFVTLEGTMSTFDPLVFTGDVFFISDGGATATDVGDFSWNVRDFEASPAAELTLSSNILQADDLLLKRFSYTEIDKVDMITGGDWNMYRRVAGASFADSYWIKDQRFLEDGIIFAEVEDNGEPGTIGDLAYFPPGDGDLFSMLLPFDADTDIFYVFIARDSDMFGRYWLLGIGEAPTGTGNYFQGSADTFQSTGKESTVQGTESVQLSQSDGPATGSSGRAALQDLEQQQSATSVAQLPQMFPPARVNRAHALLSGRKAR